MPPLREKYFYTILFLDDYFPKERQAAEFEQQVELPKIRSFEITKDANTTEMKWLDDMTLQVRHRT